MSIKYWLNGYTKQLFSVDVVDDVFTNQILIDEPRRLALLELSHYAENYLWPNFSADATDAHVWSIVAMINQKAKEGLPAFEHLHLNEALFPALFDRIINLPRSDSMLLNSHLVRFLSNAFYSLEDAMLRAECLKIVSYPMWLHLSARRFDNELIDLTPPLQKKLNILRKKHQETIYTSFMSNLMKAFITTINELPIDSEIASHIDEVRYCERFLDLMIDLVSQITTRRFFFAVLDDLHLLVHVRESAFVKSALPEAKPLNEMTKILEFYLHFPINNFTGEALTNEQVISKHYFKIQSLQKIVFKEFEEIKELALQNVSMVENKENLQRIFGGMTEERLHKLCDRLALMDETDAGNKAFMVAVLLATFRKRRSHKETMASLSLYPTERDLWEDELVGTDVSYRNERALALPKLGLQYLSFQDYLFRNYFLRRIEAASEIRADVEDAVRRLSPKIGEDGDTVYTGWSRMALPLHTSRVTTVSNPRVGEMAPSKVVAQITYSLASVKQANVREEWDSLREHDVLFLVSIVPVVPLSGRAAIPSATTPFPATYGVKSVRGCSVLDTVDEKGDRIDPNDPKQRRHGSQRFVRVLLDAAQYTTDLTNQAGSLYDSLNIVVRRKPTENNFKAIQETIVSLVNSDNAMPDWLASTFLGYPSDSTSNTHSSVFLHDTILSKEHLLSAVENVELATGSDAPPYAIERHADGKTIATSYKVPGGQKNTGKVQFTRAQVDAISRGTSEGLTLIVGPPGTGKTDVAVQIVTNLYHAHPTQRTLLITHSNNALNQLFDKIYSRDISERHLLRLGHGHSQLAATGKADFTRAGRIDHMLAARINMLARVELLAKTLGVIADVGASCETAAHFFTFDISPRYRAYETAATGTPFPFAAFFSAEGAPALQEPSECWRQITALFDELAECRAFELLKGASDRFNYLLLKQSRIVAMTCTHAALRRGELARLGFAFDNILMEEAGQIADVEAFIALQLQAPAFSERNRLRRLVLIGDHNQLPPVVKNAALQRFSHLDQSLFGRLIRLGVPHIQLDAQGRSRASIAELFNFRYKGLTNIPSADSTIANTGFFYETQIVNVDESHGLGGESEPMPHFYQNLAEAEYIVATFQYMRLLGHPAESITMLTTYNGQKELLRNIVQQKCKNNPLFGSPHKITTVDKTKSYGHIRDLRRLIVAMSRARLGLYIFCNRLFFRNCYETITVFSKFMTSDKLVLVPNEIYPTIRQRLENTFTDTPDVAGKDLETFTIENVAHMQQLVKSNLPQ
eukprot:gene13350-15703_t